MILQKALAKHYGSYESLGETSALHLLEAVTGFKTEEIFIDKDKGVFYTK